MPIVRETGGLKDTVQPYNAELNDGNGFTFDKYLPAKLLEAVNNARNLFFGDRWHWDEMVRRNMQKDVSWEKSAAQYAELYESLCK